MHLQQLVNFYLDYQRTYNKINSVNSCIHTTKALLSFWGEDKEASSLTSVDLEQFVVSRRETRKPVSVNKDLRVIRGMFNYAVESGLLPKLPFKVRMLRAPKKRELSLLSKEDIQLLIHIADNPYKTMIIIAAATGLRLSEILWLTWNDIRWEEQLLTVTGKNGWTPKSHQSRSIPLGQKTLSVLESLYAGSTGKEPEDYLFPNRKGTPFIHTSVNHELRKVWVKAGLWKKGVPILHHLRHNFCSRLLHEGVDIETARELLGHSHIMTTAIYAHTTEEQKRKAVALVDF